MSKQAGVRAAYIARAIAEAPPISDEVIDRLAVMLNPRSRVDSGPSASVLEERRKWQEREDAMKAAKKLAESLTACDVCDLQPDAHTFQKSHGAGYHDWEPGRAARVMAK